MAPRCPARVERAFAGGYGHAERAELAAAVASAGPTVAASSGTLAVAWSGPPAPAPPHADPAGCLLDGEIYNLATIARLAGVPNGAAPETVLAAAYARLGEELLTHLHGEFALLLWETRTRTGLLARDKLGSGGLFVHAEAGRLRFATELPYLLDALPRTPAPDRDAVGQWLASGTVASDRTLYEGIVPLPPASLLRLRDGRCETTRYWCPRFVGPRPLDAEDAAEELRGAVIRAVGRRLQGRRTAGILVSGGLDSGVVLGASSRAAGATETELRAYSAVFPEHRSVDESELIAAQTRYHGTPASQVAITGGRPLRTALHYLDRWRTPLPVPGLFIWEPLLAMAAGDGAECLLDGQLGDELFGAPALLMADRFRRGRLAGALRLARSFPGVGSSPSPRLILSLLGEYGLGPSLPPAAARLTSGRPAVPWWLGPAEALRYKRSVDPQPWRTLDGPRWWAQLVDAVIRAPDRIGFFDYFRRRSRAAGVPAHHPFVDFDLIDVVLRVPPEHGFHPTLSRPLLRRAMRGLVPEAVRLRPGKSYFNAMIVDCLAVEDRDVITRLLGDGNAEVLALADAAGVRTLLDGGPGGHPHGRGGWVQDVWRLATAECWLRSQSDQAITRDLLDELPAPRSGRSPRHGEARDASGRIIPFSALTSIGPPVP